MNIFVEGNDIYFLDEMGYLFCFNKMRKIVKKVIDIPIKKVITTLERLFCVIDNDKYLIISAEYNDFMIISNFEINGIDPSKYKRFKIIYDNSDNNNIDWDNAKIITSSLYPTIEHNNMFYIFRLNVTLKGDIVEVRKINKLDYDSIKINDDTVYIIHEHNFNIYDLFSGEYRLKCDLGNDTFEVKSVYYDYIDFVILKSNNAIYLCKIIRSDGKNIEITLSNTIEISDITSGITYGEITHGNNHNIIFFNRESISIICNKNLQCKEFNTDIDMNEINKNDQLELHYEFKDNEIPKYYGIRKKGAHTMM